jgi:hypothetical protein
LALAPFSANAPDHQRQESGTMMTRRLVLGSALVGLAIAGSAIGLTRSLAKEPEIYTGLIKGVAVGGYDPVAYFTEKRAVAGRPDITTSHKGATWRFASTANRDEFLKDPDRYAPRYGGYCAYGVAQGYAVKGDPQQWSVVDGRLYLNYDAGVKATWAKDIPGYLAKSEAQWPKVLGR